MSDNLDRPISPASITSEDDSTRQEFFASVRVQASPTPTPLSETPRDFQLTSTPSKLVSLSGSDVKTNPAAFANICNCGPECRQPCCVNNVLGWTNSKSKGRVGPRSVDKSAKKLELTVGDGKSTAVHSMPVASCPEEHDRVSVGSNNSRGSDHFPGESRGETPLLPPDKQHGGKFTSAANTVSEN